MKRAIRRGIFETNSSSSHSVTIRSSWDEMNLQDDFSGWFTCDENQEYVICQPEGYGWGPGSVCSAQEKLEYLLAMILSSSDNWTTTWEEFSEMGDFKKLEEWVRDHTKYKGIRVCKGREDTVYTDDEMMPDDDMYIDHQSCYPCIDAFLSDWGLTLNRYLLDNNVGVIIDNDNH